MNLKGEKRKKTHKKHMNAKFDSILFLIFFVCLSLFLIIIVDYINYSIKFFKEKLHMIEIKTLIFIFICYLKKIKVHIFEKLLFLVKLS